MVDRPMITSLHAGRFAGTGIIEERYDEESSPKRKSRPHEPKFVQKLKPAEEPCICYKLSEEELAEVLEKCKRGNSND